MIENIKNLLTLIGVTLSVILGIRLTQSNSKNKELEKNAKRKAEEAQLLSDWNDSSDDDKSNWMRANLEKRRRKDR